MAKEKTEVSPFKLFPPGRYEFVVANIPEKRKSQSGKTYRIWTLDTIEDGKRNRMRIILFPNNSKELLLALGGKEVSPDVIEWDDERVVGKRILADVSHTPGRDGKMRESISIVFERRREESNQVAAEEQSEEEKEGDDIPF